jgi:hypothetical protein
MRVRFRQMVAKNEGLFDLEGPPILYVTCMPSVTNQGYAILAVKVTGLHKDMLIPEARYVGAHWCRDFRCSDIQF